MIAKSIKGTAPEEIQVALQKCMIDGFKPTLAIVMVSIRQNRVEISKLLDNLGITIFGATTHAGFMDEVIDEQSAAILLMNVRTDYFTVLIEEYSSKNYREVAAALALKAKQNFANPSFIISGSNMETDAEQLLFGFEDIIGRNVNIHGCMAGDDFTFSEQFVFTNGKQTNNGIVMLAFDEEKIKLHGRAICGWKAVGTEKTVTKSEGNHVYTVDDIPVLNLTAKYGGLNLTPENGGFSVEVAAQYPLQLQRETGDPVMRPGLMVDWSDYSFYCSGAVPQGSKVRFSLPPDFDVIDRVIKGCEDLRKSEIPEADAVVIFSCAGRFISLGPLINDEIKGMSKVWNAPIVGMFSNAELARANGGNLEMHNLTACIVAIKEK